MSRRSTLHDDLRSFAEFGTETSQSLRVDEDSTSVPVYENEFWTSKQRDCHSLHEVSYRACYKPQLPDFFIQRYCEPGDVVCDPFMGRGTTLVQAKLRGCSAIGSDINPLSLVLAGPRLSPPSIAAVEKRLSSVHLPRAECRADLLTFFHPQTLKEVRGWKEYFRARRLQKEFDRVDAWIEMVCCNRLTGHSRGFFSVYTLPPNQATSVAAQKRINEKRNQQPEYRNTRELVLRKTRSLLADPLPRGYTKSKTRLQSTSADDLRNVRSSSVKLIVTSPPFLDTVNYEQDNWMRMWFCDAKVEAGTLWQFKRLEDWLQKMTACFREFRRILRNGGIIAFEVGEIRKGVLRLENEVIKAAVDADLMPECVMINSQSFTKTANCWGVKNNQSGTNTNRIVILRK